MAEELRWEESMLQELAQGLVYPPTPDLRASVLSSISAAPRFQAPRRLGFAAAAAAVVLLVAIGTMVVSRDARDAVAGFLGLAVEGERIEVLPTPPAGTTATPFPTAAAQIDFAQFARPISPQEAEQRVGELELPTSLGEPKALYFVSGGPNIVIADYGAIQIWQMPYSGDYFVGKGIHGSGEVIREVQVNGRPGYWVSGGERLFRIEGPNGPVAGTQRVLSANALVWSANGLYHRVEGAGTLEAAMALASEMR